MRRAGGLAAQNFEEKIFVRGLAFEAEPLRLVLVGVGVKAEQLRHLRVDVGERVRKRERSDLAHSGLILAARITLSHFMRISARPEAVLVKCYTECTQPRKGLDDVCR